jgi:hypothetical protein
MVLPMNSCGKYLGRLEHIVPDRISQRMLNGYTQWTILPPSGPDLPPAKNTATLALMAKIQALKEKVGKDESQDQDKAE